MSFNLNTYKWWVNHRKVITYGGLLFAFCLYLKPIVNEARNRQICALFLTDREQITAAEAGKKLGLKKYHFTDYRTKEKVMDYPTISYCKTLQLVK